MARGQLLLVLATATGARGFSAMPAGMTKPVANTCSDLPAMTIKTAMQSAMTALHSKDALNPDVVGAIELAPKISSCSDFPAAGLCQVEDMAAHCCSSCSSERSENRWWSWSDVTEAVSGAVEQLSSAIAGALGWGTTATSQCIEEHWFDVVLDALIDDICVYTSLPSLEQLQAKLQLYADDRAKTVQELEAASAQVDPSLIAVSEGSFEYDVSDSDAVEANFGAVATGLLTSGFFSTALVRPASESSSEMARGNIAAYAGMPAPDVLSVYEVSYLAVAAAEKTNTRVHLKLVHGEESLIVDGKYELTLSLTKTEGRVTGVTCFYAKTGRPHLGVSWIGTFLLNKDTLKENNDAQLKPKCDELVRTLR